MCTDIFMGFIILNSCFRLSNLQCIDVCFEMSHLLTCASVRPYNNNNNSNNNNNGN